MDEIIEDVLAEVTDRRDRIKGMLLGGAFGDALGANGKITYSTEMTIACIVGILRAVKEAVPRSVSTDPLTLSRRAFMTVRDRRDKILEQYLEWANSDGAYMPSNVSRHFRGIKTNEGHNRRRDRVGRTNRPISCDGLLRVAPLAVLPADQWSAVADLDCGLTGLEDVSMNAVRAYVCALRALLAGAGPAEATAAALAVAEEPEVISAITEGRDQAPQTTGEYMLYHAFYALNMARGTFQDRTSRITPRGDEGIVVGSLLGAYFGAAKIQAEDQLDAVLRSEPRLAKYGARRLPTLADALVTAYLY